MTDEYKKFCYEIFEKESKGLKNAKLKILPMDLFKLSGYVRPNFKKKNYVVVINSNIHSKMSNFERRFYTYVTICHEIEHIRIFEESKKETIFDFEYLMTIMEYISYLSEFSIPFDNEEIGFKSRQLIMKSIKNNYSISTGELKCNLEGYKKAYLNYREQSKKISTIIESLIFLNNNMQLYFDKDILAVDKFAYFLIRTSNYIKKYPQILQEYKILNNLFDNNGNIKTIYEIYSNSKNNTIVFYNKLIINLLSTIKVDDELIGNINESSYKIYLETIIDDYINSVIYYYKNIKLGMVFIEKEKILYENLKILLNRVKNLDTIVETYNLNKKTGLIL